MPRRPDTRKFSLGIAPLGTFYQSDTETEFPGIWTYLHGDVDIFSIWAFLRAIIPHNTPSRSVLFLSAKPEFLQRGEVFKQKFPGVGPSQKTCEHTFHQITTPPRPSHLNHDQDRAAAFSTYLVNDDQKYT